MSVYIPVALRREITLLDKERCAYCQTPAAIIGSALEIDHIHPVSKGGETIRANLCMVCQMCNRRKSDRIVGYDSLLQVSARLFHPRIDNWHTHFKWRKDGVYIGGRTAIGRATIETLVMNNRHVVRSRSKWVSVGWHPPSD